MVDSLGFIAHVDMEGKTQTLENHAEEVARRCSEFCTQIDKDWGNVGTLLGLLHDHGKYQKLPKVYTTLLWAIGSGACPSPS